MPANSAMTSPVAEDKASVGDPLPTKCAVIEVHVAELSSCLILSIRLHFVARIWTPVLRSSLLAGRRTCRVACLLRSWLISIARPVCRTRPQYLRAAIHEFFRQRAEAYRRQLRDLFRRGRTSLLIGLAVLAAAIALGDFLASLMKTGRIGEIVRESLTIGGWVSMWRPLEVFLYDWWPIRNEARLSDRLAAMPVRIRYLNAKSPDAWKADWPATPSAEGAKEGHSLDAFNQSAQ